MVIESNLLASKIESEMSIGTFQEDVPLKVRSETFSGYEIFK